MTCQRAACEDPPAVHVRAGEPRRAAGERVDTVGPRWPGERAARTLDVVLLEEEDTAVVVDVEQLRVTRVHALEEELFSPAVPADDVEILLGRGGESVKHETTRGRRPQGAPEREDDRGKRQGAREDGWRHRSTIACAARGGKRGGREEAADVGD